MLRDMSEIEIQSADEGMCDPECGCAPGQCAAAGFLPEYKPNDFKRNVTAMAHALENFSFAAGVVSRLIEEAYLLDEETVA